ncbi:MAG: hypothetical protein AAF268_03500 [Cyanobacteria bacterium P01_A01_bin.3]
MKSLTLSSFSLYLSVAAFVVLAAPSIALSAYVVNSTSNPRLEEQLGNEQFEIAREDITEIELLR